MNQQVGSIGPLLGSKQPNLVKETALVAEAKAGNADAFAALVSRYDNQLYRVALRITDNREDAEEALQESFLQAHLHLTDFRGDSRFSTWLIRIAVNQAIAKRRRRIARREVSLDEPPETAGIRTGVSEAVDPADDPETSCFRRELRRLLNETLVKLAPQYRVVLILHDLDGFRNEHVARRLRLSLPATKARLSRARSNLRKAALEAIQRSRH